MRPLLFGRCKLHDINVRRFRALLEDSPSILTNECWTSLGIVLSRVKQSLLPKMFRVIRTVVSSSLKISLMLGWKSSLLRRTTQVNKLLLHVSSVSGPHEHSSTAWKIPETRDDGDVMFIEIVKKNDDSRKEEPEAGGLEVGYFDIFPTRSELAYHKYLMCGPILSIFLRNPIIT
ncbi:hypothetical protein Tco_0252910 [Tanacetum coccineum]